MRTLVILAGLLITVAALLGTVAWVLLQPGFAKTEIAAAVDTAIGRDFEAGAPRLSLYPETLVTVPDIRIAGPAAGDFITARELRLTVDPARLLSRRIGLRAVTVVGARITLATDGSGRSTWPTGASRFAGLPPIAIADSVIAFRDGRDGIAFEGREASGTLAFDAAGGFAFEGRMIVGDRPLDVVARAASIDRLLRDGSPFSLAVRGPAIDVGFDGRLRLADGVELVGQANAAAPDAAELAALLAPKPPAWLAGRMATIAGAVEVKRGAIAFQDAAVFLGGWPAKGRATIDFSGAVPRLEADLAADDFDFGVGRFAALLPGQWSERRFDFAGLSGFALKVTLATQRIRAGVFEMGPARIAVDLADHRLDIAFDDVSILGGQASGSFQLDGASTPPVLAVAAQGKGIALPGAGSFNEASLALRGAGHSPAELAAALAGTAQFKAIGGALPGLDLEALVRAVSQGIVTGWPRAAGQATAFDLVSGSFALEDGIALSDDLRFAGPGLDIAAEGEIDLFRRAIDFRAEPKIDGSGMPVKVIARGPWDAPRFYPDMPGILEDPAAAMTALRKLGLPLALETAP